MTTMNDNHECDLGSFQDPFEVLQKTNQSGKLVCLIMGHLMILYHIQRV